MPYRVDFRNPGGDTLDRLLELGAIDADVSSDGAMAALLPDSIAPERLVNGIGMREFSVSPDTGRDAGSI